MGNFSVMYGFIELFCKLLEMNISLIDKKNISLIVSILKCHINKRRTLSIIYI